MNTLARTRAILRKKKIIINEYFFFASFFAAQQNYPSFWPEKSKMEKYGPVFSVHSVSRKHYANIKQWEYKINKKVRI